MIIKNGKIIKENEIVKGSIEIEDGKIIKIYEGKYDFDDAIDAEGLYVSPGFIDVHIHAIEGFDCMEGSFDAVNEMSKSLIKYGVTSFLPATMTEDTEKIKNAVKSISQAIGKTEGANLLGINLEGPFISPYMAGAQDTKYIKKPSLDTLKHIAEDYIKNIKLLTIAPEEEGAIGLIKELKKLDIVTSIGHTKGNYEDFIKGYEAGALHCTHIFNAMTGFHHREPGIVGGVFDSDVTAELILDGIHVHYAAARSTIKVKGIEKIILISDSMMAAGLSDGIYSLGGQEVYVKDGQARLKDGTLAGSTLTLNKALYNAVKHLNLPLYEAVKMVSSNPAKLLKLDNKKGVIKENFDADIVIFDEDINIKNVFVKGKKIC
ncbi:N-acetylglucosamine 6-phosphate deacetylase [Caloramator quimbayensis]|uniref:N-acetylglucosamine-6-phosphate deacetylase n=1 Tax=Caloramator quimbayensis TaxID=1147123 RepID=A0A1T4WFB2_9CLOT|nr:N-acetylglucosamine-6-phosphate deacetylase [Caloramator quimbayensis]SKA75688.1 N-acetylglucosamine 6-phosphate deacetylase [Caloramator quimbayensis]